VAINSELTLLYWHIGRRISDEVLGNERAEYGKQVVVGLAKALTAEYGKGWGNKQLLHCIRFAESFSDITIVSTVSRQLSWSHFQVLIYLKEPLARDFYAQMCQLERWSVRVLRKQVGSMLFERTAISKKPEQVVEHTLIELAKTGDVNTDLLLKDPYLLDFLSLNDRYLEKNLEDAILREMEQFLLELGAGFTFVARQKRIQIDDDDFYIDLLFYNRKLKRLVAIDLKIDHFRHSHKSQMELYLRWLAKFEQEDDELPPIGIILCTGKKQEQIELLEMDKSGIHVAEYLTELPPKALLEQRLRQALENARNRADYGNTAPESDL
jgi:predicted nuclease of restriction endonuclease-like (RecB) superfamily